jgi:hypothetical protein
MTAILLFCLFFLIIPFALFVLILRFYRFLLGFSWLHAAIATLVVFVPGSLAVFMIVLEGIGRRDEEMDSWYKYNMAPLLILGGLFVLNFVIVILRRRRLKRGA